MVQPDVLLNDEKEQVIVHGELKCTGRILLRTDTNQCTIGVNGRGNLNVGGGIELGAPLSLSSQDGTIEVDIDTTQRLSVGGEVVVFKSLTIELPNFDGGQAQTQTLSLEDGEGLSMDGGLRINGTLVVDGPVRVIGGLVLERRDGEVVVVQAELLDDLQKGVIKGRVEFEKGVGIHGSAQIDEDFIVQGRMLVRDIGEVAQEFEHLKARVAQLEQRAGLTPPPRPSSKDRPRPPIDIPGK